MKQLGDGHLPRRGSTFAGLQVRLDADKLECLIIELELAVLDELEDGGGSEWLADTGNPEQRIGCHRLFHLHVGVTESSRE